MSTEAPPLFVVGGEATEEEIAALTAVLTSIPAMAPAATAPASPFSAWATPRRRMHAPLFPGRGSWRASALPE